MNRDRMRASIEERERGCERAGELIAHLYGESDAAEASSFEQHLSVCAVCRDELAAFGGVRAGVAQWRDAALSAMPALALDDAFALPASGGARPVTPTRSARRALREFFALSPLWLRAGAFAAALVVCALAALAFARTEVRWDDGGLAIRSGIPERVVEKRVEVPVGRELTPEQLDALVRAGVERELAAARSRSETNDGVEVSAQTTAATSKKSATRFAKAVDATARNARRAPDASNARRGRQNLARYDEEDLPRLTDLLDEVN